MKVVRGTILFLAIGDGASRLLGSRSSSSSHLTTRLAFGLLCSGRRRTVSHWRPSSVVLLNFSPRLTSKLRCHLFLSLILLDSPIEGLLDALPASFEIDVAQFGYLSLPRTCARFRVVDSIVSLEGG
jgi:hypothetical protein